MWFYNNEVVTPEMCEEYYGFVYLITNLTNDRKYIGRKYLTKSKTRQIKGKKKKFRVPSDWETYYGSNKTLIEETEIIGKENFRREILYFCGTRSECSYYETLEIFQRGALLKEEYYNEWVSCKIRKSNLKVSTSKGAPILSKGEK